MSEEARAKALANHVRYFWGSPHFVLEHDIRENLKAHAADKDREIAALKGLARLEVLTGHCDVSCHGIPGVECLWCLANELLADPTVQASGEPR